MLHATNSQIWVTRKEHAEHVPYLSLIPVCTTEDRDHAWDRVCFPCICLYPNPAGVFNAEQVVYNLEAFLSLWEINRGDIGNTLELALGVVSQEG